MRVMVRVSMHDAWGMVRAGLVWGIVVNSNSKQ